MSAVPSPCSASPSTRGAALPFGGHRVEVAAEHDPALAAELGAGDDVVADPVDRRAPGASRAAGPRRGRRARVSSMAHRRDRDQLRGRAREVDRSASRGVTPPRRARMSLSFALSWRSPSVSRLTHEHARAGRTRRRGTSAGRVADTATHQSGTTPRPSSSPVSASITGIVPVRMQPGAEHDAVADAGALGDDAARADACVSSPIDDRRRLRRFEHAADADAAREVDPFADLRARADRRPGVDHRVGADAGADVHVARHQDRRPGARYEPQRADAPGTTRTPRRS